MTLEEVSPECGKSSPHLLSQLVAVCPPRKAELNRRRADQRGYVRDAGVNESGPDVEQVLERALQQDFPRGLRFGRLHLLVVEWPQREAEGHQEEAEWLNHLWPSWPAWPSGASPSYVHVGLGAQLEVYPTIEQDHRRLQLCPVHPELAPCAKSLAQRAAQPQTSQCPRPQQPQQQQCASPTPSIWVKLMGM